MSRYIKEVHRCETPEILSNQNTGTVWECDCKLRYVISYVSGAYSSVEYGWSRLESWKFNEAEDRLLTPEEVLAYYRARLIQPTRWERFTWRFRR